MVCELMVVVSGRVEYSVIVEGVVVSFDIVTKVLCCIISFKFVVLSILSCLVVLKDSVVLSYELVVSLSAVISVYRVRISVWFANAITVYLMVVASVVIVSFSSGSVMCVVQFGVTVIVEFIEQMQVVILCAFVMHFTAPTQLVRQGSIH